MQLFVNNFLKLMRGCRCLAPQLERLLLILHTSTTNNTNTNTAFC